MYSIHLISELYKLLDLMTVSTMSLYDSDVLLAENITIISEMFLTVTS